MHITPHLTDNSLGRVTPFLSNEKSIAQHSDYVSDKVVRLV